MIFGRGRRRSDASDFQQALRRSLRAAVEGDSARAQTWLERAVELDSNDFDAYQALARLYRDRGEIGRAIRMHQNLLLRSDLGYEERAAARLELARDLEAGGFVERALSAYEELLAERPRDVALLRTLAAMQIERENVEQAEALVARLRRLDPAAAEPIEHRLDARWPERALARRRRGLVSRFVTRFGAGRREQDEERSWRARLERAPDDHAARIALVRHLFGRERREEALALLARGLEIDPQALALHVERGRLALSDGAAGEVGAALGALLDALEARARDAEAAGQDAALAAATGTGPAAATAAEAEAAPQAEAEAAPQAEAEVAPGAARAARAQGSGS